MLEAAEPQAAMRPKDHPGSRLKAKRDKQSGPCGAKAEDMDHQTLLCAHYSLQKARTLPRSHRDIKSDEADI